MPSPSDDDDIELLEEMPWTASSTRIRTLTNGGTTQGQNLPQIKRIDAEIADIDAQIASLRTLRTALQADRRQHLRVDLSSRSSSTRMLQSGPYTSEYKVTDYTGKTERFEWSHQMKATMKSVWGIDEFRLCQEGVCNANMDGRDILCLMPTGGGKSITYQLPALLSPGVTIVISPLLSLINDQIMHLRQAGVECVMLTGNTSKQEQNDAFHGMTKKANDGGRSNSVKVSTCTKGEEDQSFLQGKISCVMLQEDRQKQALDRSPRTVGKLASARYIYLIDHDEAPPLIGRLTCGSPAARIVIDEAHCCSALGHDFRPDYKKLSVLKTLFPKVPILAVTATLSQKVLPDVLKILRLAPLTSGAAANAEGTCAFGAELYRKNLHYSVLPKSSNAKLAIEQMAGYILSNHPKQSGIVYCLSKKDAESVAQGIHEASNGLIKTGVYHADVIDSYKEAIHRDWKVGKIHCVCATIAFGLGIDKAETRYVLHASMSKSMDGYYQETGRAGRDGLDADCVLYFRHQDATRVLALTLGEIDGSDKVHDMLSYAQDLVTCRKLAFNSYFATSASQVLQDGRASKNTPSRPCGHCDNCTRASDDLETLDVTTDVWRSLKVMMEVSRRVGRVTLSGLADLVRGLGGGTFTLVGTVQSAADRGRIDLEAVCGGKVTLNKERTETLLIDLILKGYLQEDYHATAYSVNVYVQPGPKAMRYARLTNEAIHKDPHCPRYEYTFLVANTARNKSKMGGTAAAAHEDQPKAKGRNPTRLPTSNGPSRKRPRRAARTQSELIVDSDIERMALMEEDDFDFSD